MTQHPIIRSKAKCMVAGAGFLLATAACGWLLLAYGGESPTEVLWQTLWSMACLAALGFAFWYVIGLLNIPQLDWLLSAPVLAVWLGLTFFIDGDRNILPLRLVTGSFLWTILLLWYRIERLAHWKTDRLVQEATLAPLEPIVERITVKSGSRIHIVRVADIRYIQACGDYVMLYTPEGEFLKELTMKSLETHLPTDFVRIHRSYIVNTEQIARIELFGKESYNVYLKSGATLRASLGGYKALKEMLDI